MAGSHTLIRTRIQTRTWRSFPIATVVLCRNFLLHGFGLGSQSLLPSIVQESESESESESKSAYMNKPLKRQTVFLTLWPVPSVLYALLASDFSWP